MSTAPVDEAEERALATLRAAGDAIVAGAEALIPGWVAAQVARILDLWGRAEPAARAEAERAALVAGPAAAARVAASLRALLARDPAEQGGTPLQVVRTVVQEPTAILAAAGVAPVERDGFDERAQPDDRYDLCPRTLGDLGDPELAPLLLVWGTAKARVLAIRRDRHP